MTHNTRVALIVSLLMISLFRIGASGTIDKLIERDIERLEQDYSIQFLYRSQESFYMCGNGETQIVSGNGPLIKILLDGAIEERYLSFETINEDYIELIRPMNYCGENNEVVLEVWFHHEETLRRVFYQYNLISQDISILVDTGNRSESFGSTISGDYICLTEYTDNITFYNYKTGEIRDYLIGNDEASFPFYIDYLVYSVAPNRIAFIISDGGWEDRELMIYDIFEETYDIFDSIQARNYSNFQLAGNQILYCTIPYEYLGGAETRDHIVRINLDTGDSMPIALLNFDREIMQFYRADESMYFVIVNIRGENCVFLVEIPSII